MSKITDALNQIWYEQDGKQVKVGLTRSFLDQLDECWHILPGNLRNIKAKTPLMTMETNDGLIPIMSPVSGNVVRWETRATNFPDQLTEEDVIMVLTSEKVAEKEDVGMSIDFEASGMEPVFGARTVRAAGVPLRGDDTAVTPARPWRDRTTAAPPPAPRVNSAWQVDFLRNMVARGNIDSARVQAEAWGMEVPAVPGIRAEPF